MNREGLDAFFTFLSENPEHHTKVTELGGDVDATIAYARELGYDISPDELQKYQNQAREIIKGRMRKVRQEQAQAPLSPGAKAFFEMINLADTDEAVAERLTELATAAPEELIAYGKEKGFVFDEKDMQAIGDSILEPTDELSDEELEMAAGGIVDLIALAVFVGIGLGVAVAGGVGVAAGVGAVAGFVLGFTALSKK